MASTAQINDVQENRCAKLRKWVQCLVKFARALFPLQSRMAWFFLKIKRLPEMATRIEQMNGSRYGAVLTQTQKRGTQTVLREFAPILAKNLRRLKQNNGPNFCYNLFGLDAGCGTKLAKFTAIASRQNYPRWCAVQ